MHKIITFFKQSSHARRHLNTSRVQAEVGRGLESIGKTQFCTIYYASASVGRCLPLIKNLIEDGVLKKTHALQFMKNAAFAMDFELKLKQLIIVLAPIAKATKCLEAVDTTPADVYLFWLTVMASYHELFDTSKQDELEIESGDVILEQVCKLVNIRYKEMSEGPGKHVYLTTFFLNPLYIESSILRRHS
ncbi:hypothetical protein EW146_g7972 [Bondarzewia mesenterica]|uniref:Uncharacterized protein n=1 Tax=Bondarzewia mesenterica TaxID=1095465 RepID=A0A4S4LI81_9AGAM|nr:hypothetical protein EW146_g7972 [Bondarzewia mesenterica]